MCNPLSDQSVLVTGAGGFIGCHLVETLVQRGASVRALLGPGDNTWDWQHERVTTAQAEIGDLEEIRQLAEGVDCFVHLAGPASVRNSFSEAAHYAQVHVAGTAGMLQLAQSVGASRFVHISSAEVYGRPLQNPVSEEHRLNARSPYAACKIGAERLVESFTHSTDLKGVVLRPFSIYGPGQSAQSLLGTICHQAETEEAITLADLRPVRDYCYVIDLVEAIAGACYAKIDAYSVLNIGSGQGISVADLAKLVTQLLGRELEIKEAEQGDRPKKSDIHELISDCRRVKEVLGWSPRFSLSDGLEKTIQTFISS